MNEVPRVIGLARPTINYPKINRIKCGLFVSIGVLMMAPKLSAQGISVGSKDLNAICHLSINDKTYLDAPVNTSIPIIFKVMTIFRTIESQ